ncbi:ricin B lectin (RBL4e) [Vairimorpha necatrix]|uniref:Ricin B lectin (RBL4e) n=1 Tax=Vairimorpha necatrix TaxID=6039 RepID=A0AAX4JEZ6_9MICR
MYFLILQFFSNLCYSAEVIFTNDDSELNLCSKDGNNVFGCNDKDDIIRTEINQNEDGQIFLNVLKYDKVFTIKENKLILFSKTGGSNQIFDVFFYYGSSFLIKNKDKCIYYDKEKNIFRTGKCEEGSTVFSLRFESKSNYDIKKKADKSSQNRNGTNNNKDCTSKEIPCQYVSTNLPLCQ